MEKLEVREFKGTYGVFAGEKLVTRTTSREVAEAFANRTRVVSQHDIEGDRPATSQRESTGEEAIVSVPQTPAAKTKPKKPESAGF